jgi:peptide chain release factor 1
MSSYPLVLSSQSELIRQVLPIYPDTPDAPLVEAKDVKTEVMRSRGAGGQVRNLPRLPIR